MAEYLVIRLSATSEPEWALVDELGAQLMRPRRGELNLATESAEGRKVIALLPALNVLRTSIEVPVRSGAKLLQALPFAMEDQLADDVEQLHFAAGRRDEEGRVPVAVIDDAALADCLEEFSDAGLTPTAVYSEGEALGEIPGTNILLLEPDYGVLRHSDGSLTAVDYDGLRSTLELWLASRKREIESDSDDESLGRPQINVLVYMSDRGADRHLELVEWLRHEVDTLDEKLLADGPLPRMASQVVARPGINLLQGRYAQRSNLAVYWPAWRIAAMLLVGLFVALLAVKGGELYQLNRQDAVLDDAIASAFRYTFPEVRITNKDDVGSLLDSKLKSLNRGNPRNARAPFLDTLSRVARSVAEAEAVELEAISYRSGVMDLRVRSLNVEALDRIQKSVSGDGLQAEIQSANADDGQVLGRLQIKSR